MSRRPKEKPYPMVVALTVSDMKQSIAFHRDRLGFAVGESWPGEDDPK